MCAISVFLFAKIIALGKCGKRIAWRNKFEATHRLGKKSCFCLVLILLTSLLAWREGKDIGRIMERVHKPQPHPRPPHHYRSDEPIVKEFYEMPLDEGSIMSVDLMDGRHLREIETTQAPMTFGKGGKIPAALKDDEDTCNALTDEGACHDNKVCSWCTAGAVKPACHSIENAKRLPPSIFECSPLSAP
jgi:hypothetical protein